MHDPPTNSTVSRREDGWYDVNESLPRDDNVLPPNQLQVTQLALSNALGLDIVGNSSTVPQIVRLPSSTYSATVGYHDGSPHPSHFVNALANDMLSPGRRSFRASPSVTHSPSVSYRMEVSPRQSPRYPVRPLPSTIMSSVRPLPPVSSAPPQLPAVLPPLSAPRQRILRLPGPPNQEISDGRPRKRKRTKQVSVGGSEDDKPASDTQESRVRPTLLLTAAHTAPTSAPLATQHLAAIRSASSPAVAPVVIRNGSGSDDDMNDRPRLISASDEQVVESLYEEEREGDVIDLRNLCSLVHKLLEDQAELSRSVKQIDARTRQMAANPLNQSTGGGTHGGTYVSPPEPTSPVNWDQSIQYDAPAGRKRRATRRVLIMGLIRETIFELLSRRSVHDPLPPPPPPRLQAPTELNFAVRWQESSNSIFNQIAANIVAQKVIAKRTEMLSAEETEELPSMVSKHIKYLCRCYKDQNREDAEEFNAQRLSRCGAGTRKRQVFATRLQVLDMFPEVLGKHRHLIAHLGVDGTSSDEEEPKGGGIYKIKNIPQLSSKVTLLKRDLDHVYQLYFKGPGTKGSQMHRRVPSNVDTTRPFLIQGLPVSCVSRAWYQGLEPAEREFFDFSPHNYDFSFPMSLLKVPESCWPAGERVRDVSP